MSKLLVYTSPARGHLYPIVPTLEELRRRGHDVVVRTLSSEVPLLVRLGFHAAPIDPRIEAVEHDDWRTRTVTGGQHRNLTTFLARAPLDLEDLRKAIDEGTPDLALVDVNTWGAAIAAEAWGGPWALFSPYTLPIPSRDAPPFGLGLRPRTGSWGRVRDAVVAAGARYVWDRLLREINALRAGAGLHPLARATDLFLRAPLTLAYTAEPFEYPRSDWAASVSLVGPGCWDPPAERPGWLDDIDRPLVVVVTSTERQGDGRLISATLAALAREPVFVAASSPSVDPSAFSIPPNAKVERWLPHGAVIPRAACVVCHGGMGITQKSLAAGVPVCVVPFGRDQLEVARRVEVAEAGTRAAARRLDPQRLRNAIRQAMDRRAGAERIARAFSATGGPIAAADELEDVLGAGMRGGESAGLADGERPNEGVSR